MGLLNGQTAYEFARELTIKAIENKMLVTYETADETAKEVCKFFNTAFEELADSDD